MKKLMTLMGVTAFALGAFADAYVANKVGFEENYYTTGSGVTAVTEEYGDKSNAYMWYCADGDGDSKVEEYGGAAKYNYGASDNLLNGPGNKYLSVSTSGNNPLYRTLAGRDTKDAEPTQQSFDGDIVADTLVQFTASPTAQTPETGAKFALWLLGEDPTEVASPKTNLVVTAGSYDGTTVTPANYNLDVANLSLDQWYRVTVRAVNGIGTMQGSKVGMGFVVYINGTAVTCADADYADTFGTIDVELSTEALILKDRKQLFPSMVLDSARTLAGVGFQGTGKVDDLSIVDIADEDKPSFVAATTGFVITWSEGVVSFKVGADTYTTAGKDYVVVEPVGGAVAITDVVYAPSYSKGTWDKKNATLDGETFTLSGNIASGKIVATTSVFEIDGQTYETLGAALLAAGTAGEAVTIKAVNSFNASADFGETAEYEVYEIGSDVILDLAGCTITDDRDTEQFTDELFSVIDGAALVVIDSKGGGKIVATNDRALFYEDEGTITVGAATGDEGVTIDGAIGSAALVRGFFNDTGAKDLVADGSTFYEDPDEAGFYTVAPGSTPPEPTTYTVTFSYTVPGAESATVSTVDVEDGTLLSALTWPTLPTVTGYTAAWPTYAEGATVTADVTFTANYTPETYTVTFYTNSVTVAYTTVKYTYGDASTYTAPSDPVVDGFEFGGWFTDNGTFKTAFSFSADVADDTNVYAKLTEEQPPEDDYPTYIPTEDATAKAKYDSWAKYAGVTTAAAAEELEEAYLLNCKPDEVAEAKAAFKFTSITKDGDTWVTTTTTGYNNRDYNGTVTVKSYSDVGCTTESETGTFFRATLTLK